VNYLNRDTFIALVLLLLCGAFWASSTQIPEMGYATIGSEVWPRIVISAMAAMSLIYLAGAVRGRYDGDGVRREAGGGIGGWFAYYRNPLICFVLFFLFLLSLPWLGMLIGGALFVFLALTILGERTARWTMIHLGISVFMVGAMWAIFTFGLQVILPEGELLRGMF